MKVYAWWPIAHVVGMLTVLLARRPIHTPTEGRERETDRQTDRQRHKHRQNEGLFVCGVNKWRERVRQTDIELESLNQSILFNVYMYISTVFSRPLRLSQETDIAVIPNKNKLQLHFLISTYQGWWPVLSVGVSSSHRQHKCMLKNFSHSI